VARVVPVLAAAAAAEETAMRAVIFLFGALLTAQAWSAASATTAPPASAADATPAAAATATAQTAARSGSTADHARFNQLDKVFKSGPELTRACLECHTEAAKQVHTSKHWNWQFTNPADGKAVGKKNMVNNFCTATTSNEKGCTACHIGYGWQDNVSFDFKSEENVDCVVCHDTTGTYRKLPGDAGHPLTERRELPPKSGRFVEPIDLRKVAQNVGKTSRKSCGACHFFGGGGDAVKHGDLDSSMTNPPRYLDVHMDARGLNFSCSTCHQSDGHEVAGSRVSLSGGDAGTPIKRGAKNVSASGRSVASCQACHGNTPHHEAKPKDGKPVDAARMARLDQHTDKLACPTCHVPEFARGGIATKMRWDWSTATRLSPEGKPLLVKDSAGRIAYDSKKGDFAWEADVIPEYRWLNGKSRYTVMGDAIDPAKLVEINRFEGGPDDPASKIWPLKVHRGKQPYDTEHKTLAVMHTFGADETALWTNYDFAKSIAEGMRVAGLPYSGKFDFVETEMSWPITHMVAPKDDALACSQCHARNGRLSGIDGVYIPGQHRLATLDAAGFGIALLALLGVLGHGGLRYLAWRRNGGGQRAH
jgi:octaheme c-type cytochrome (tetrathionate reductase family)